MPTKPKPKNTSRPPRDPEAIAAVIARAPARARRDADSPPSRAGDWDHAIVSHSLGELRAKLAARRTRGPNKLPVKEQVAVRYSPEVLAAFRASGRGWQTRMDKALRDWLKTHTPVAE